MTFVDPKKVQEGENDAWRRIVSLRVRESETMGITNSILEEYRNDEVIGDIDLATGKGDTTEDDVFIRQFLLEHLLLHHVDVLTTAPPATKSTNTKTRRMSWNVLQNIFRKIDNVKKKRNETPSHTVAAAAAAAAAAVAATDRPMLGNPVLNNEPQSPQISEVETEKNSTNDATLSTENVGLSDPKHHISIVDNSVSNRNGSSKLLLLNSLKKDHKSMSSDDGRREIANSHSKSSVDIVTAKHSTELSDVSRKALTTALASKRPQRRAPTSPATLSKLQKARSPTDDVHSYQPIQKKMRLDSNSRELLNTYDVPTTSKSVPPQQFFPRDTSSTIDHGCSHLEIRKISKSDTRETIRASGMPLEYAHRESNQSTTYRKNGQWTDRPASEYTLDRGDSQNSINGGVYGQYRSHPHISAKAIRPTEFSKTSISSRSREREYEMKDYSSCHGRFSSLGKKTTTPMNRYEDADGIGQQSNTVEDYMHRLPSTDLIGKKTTSSSGSAVGIYRESSYSRKHQFTKPYGKESKPQETNYYGPLGDNMERPNKPSTVPFTNSSEFPQYCAVTSTDRTGKNTTSSSSSEVGSYQKTGYSKKHQVTKPYGTLSKTQAINYYGPLGDNIEGPNQPSNVPFTKGDEFPQDDAVASSMKFLVRTKRDDFSPVIWQCHLCHATNIRTYNLSRHCNNAQHKTLLDANLNKNDTSREPELAQPAPAIRTTTYSRSERQPELALRSVHDDITSTSQLGSFDRQSKQIFHSGNDASKPKSKQVHGMDVAVPSRKRANNDQQSKLPFRIDQNTASEWADIENFNDDITSTSQQGSFDRQSKQIFHNGNDASKPKSKQVHGMDVAVPSRNRAQNDQQSKLPFRIDQNAANIWADIEKSYTNLRGDPSSSAVTFSVKPDVGHNAIAGTCKQRSEETVVSFSPFHVKYYVVPSLAYRLQEWDPFWIIKSIVCVGLTQPIRSSQPDSDLIKTAAQHFLFKNLDQKYSGLASTNGNRENRDLALLLRMLPAGADTVQQNRADSHLWPKGTFLQINGKPCQIVQRKQQAHLLTEWKYVCKEFDASAILTKTSERSCIQICCADEDKYYYLLSHCQYRAPRNLYFDIKKSITTLSFQSSIEKAQAFANGHMTVNVDNENEDNLEAETGKFIFALTCPISRKAIVTPVRGRDCMHFQCFDLRNYIDLNVHISGTRWRCASCEKFVSLKNLEMCNLTFRILKEFETVITSDRDRVEFTADGKYHLLPEREARSKKRQQSDAMASSEEKVVKDGECIVDLYDSESS